MVTKKQNNLIGNGVQYNKIRNEDKPIIELAYELIQKLNSLSSNVDNNCMSVFYTSFNNQDTYISTFASKEAINQLTRFKKLSKDMNLQLTLEDTNALTVITMRYSWGILKIKMYEIKHVLNTLNSCDITICLSSKPSISLKISNQGNIYVEGKKIYYPLTFKKICEVSRQLNRNYTTQLFNHIFKAYCKVFKSSGFNYYQTLLNSYKQCKIDSFDDMLYKLPTIYIKDILSSSSNSELLNKMENKKITATSIMYNVDDCNLIFELYKYRVANMFKIKNIKQWMFALQPISKDSDISDLTVFKNCSNIDKPLLTPELLFAAYYLYLNIFTEQDINYNIFYYISEYLKYCKTAKSNQMLIFPHQIQSAKGFIKKIDELTFMSTCKNHLKTFKLPPNSKFLKSPFDKRCDFKRIKNKKTLIDVVVRLKKENVNIPHWQLVLYIKKMENDKLALYYFEENNTLYLFELRKTPKTNKWKYEPVKSIESNVEYWVKQKARIDIIINCYYHGY